MSLEELGQAVETGDQDKAKLLAQKFVGEGVDLMQMIAALTEVMERVGEKFSRLEIFLPEMVLTGGAMTAVMQILTPHLAAKGRGAPKAKVVLGTVKGDLHEIGKNIVKLMLESSFYEVKDLGTDVDPVDFIKEAEAMQADIIGASSLMTTTLPHQKEIIDILEIKGLRQKYKVVVGGAPVTQAWADEIGADLYCPDAGSAPKMLSDLLQK